MWAMAARSAVVIVNGQEITFSGEDFDDFQAADGPVDLQLHARPGRARDHRLIPDEAVIYRINAGATVTAIDGGPDWIGDNR